MISRDRIIWRQEKHEKKKHLIEMQKISKGNNTEFFFLKEYEKGKGEVVLEELCLKHSQLMVDIQELHKLPRR